MFVYGTLMADEVVHVLLKRNPQKTPAILHGYVRHRVNNHVYPAIVPGTSNDKVTGVVRGWLCWGPLRWKCRAWCAIYMLP